MKTNYLILIAFAMILASSFYTNAQSGDSLDDKILIITHMQNNYYKGELSKDATQDELEKINKLIKSTNPDNVVYSKATQKILNLTLKKIFVEEKIKDLDDRLDVINQNVFVDHGGDIFSSKELIDYLERKNVKQIVIVGREASGCIKTSVESGLALGYDMYLISDAIVGKSSKSKLRSIKKLKQKGAKDLILN